MMDFIKLLFENSFKETDIPDYNPGNNWLGVSKYHPDARFVNGNKEIILSLQGVRGCSWLSNEVILNNWNLFSSNAARIILFLENGQVKYLSVSGVFPPSDIIESFIKTD